MNNNYSMLLDLYEFTMSNGILHSKNKDTICYFDMFFRRVPDEGGFAIMAGLEQLIDYLKNLKFTKEDIDYTVDKLAQTVEKLRAMSPLC